MFQSLLCWTWDSKCFYHTTRCLTTTRFNPCCAGRGIRRIFLYIEKNLNFSGFNPCCAGRGIRSKSKSMSFFQAFEFQSLLCWTWDSKFPNQPVVFENVHCFNPCCAGRGIRSIGFVWFSYGLSTGFQSLLCWTWDSKELQLCLCRQSLRVSILVVLDVGFEVYSLTILAVQLTSFNPCCAGRGIRRQKLLPYLDKIMTFQSLLCWTWDSKKSL